jgi:hypothetical protein
MGWYRRGAIVRLEAETLADMVSRGVDSADRMRRLIVISPDEQQDLRKSFRPGLVEDLVKFRIEILRQFESLIRADR